MKPKKHTNTLPGARDASGPSWGAIGGVALLALLAHAPGILNGFIAEYDDAVYVLQNPAVQRGLSLSGLVYSFTETCAANWHPLTMLSHMTDVTFFGLWAPGHHGIAILLHVCNSVLVLLLLYALTMAGGRSVAVACLFAVHPIHVESVAQIAQRKDLLCGLFFLLALMAYVRYTRKSSRGAYTWLVVFTTMAVLSKPVAVTLPCAMLLLDYWPLKRLDNLAERNRALLEKMPLFGIVAILSVVTFLVQRASGVVQRVDLIPLSLRFANAAVAYCAYIGKALWPFGLSPFYAFPVAIPAWKTALATAFLLLVTCAAAATRRKYPWFITGWLWFLGTLVPMIGIVQVGVQSMADRYAYLTFIGLYIILVWGSHEIIGRLMPRLTVAIAAITVLLLIPLTMIQTTYWRDAETLWRRALELDPTNHRAHGNLSLLRAAEGNYEAALAHQLESVKTFQRSTYYDNLGVSYLKLGRIPEAIAAFQRATKLEPLNSSAHFNLGVAYCIEKRPDEAERAFEEVRGKTAGFYKTTGDLLLQHGYPERALRRLETAKQMDVALPGINQSIERARRKAGVSTKNLPN